jgi:luciferase family oxidoreductase group 1
MTVTPMSLLDLVPVAEGATASVALADSLDLARQAESFGYSRVWVAEHHNMEGVASSATSVVLAHLAAGTQRIRIGAGGVMLPNHAPLAIAEQFGTLEALHPGRIDLGLGRAPGSDLAASRALRRRLESDPDRFPQDVVELLGWLEPAAEGQAVRAIPGAGAKVEVWILGSSLFGAQVAAALGLPFAFASHFAPGDLDAALQTYRDRFRPSAYLDRPHVMVAANVIAAPSRAEADYLFTSLKQAFANLRAGRPGKLPRPVEGLELHPVLEAAIAQALSCSAVGTVDDVRSRLRWLLDRTGADELILSSSIWDHSLRVRSLRLASEAMGLS